MRLATFLPPGADDPRAGEVRGDGVVAFASGTVLDRLASGDRTPADGDGARAGRRRRCSRPSPRPRAIFGIGLNYAAHARETGKEPPEAPIVFMKLPTSSVPPAGPVSCPKVVRRLDYEVELAWSWGRRRDRRLRGRRRRLRPRPAGARAAVDAREGRGHVLPVGPVDHDRRRRSPDAEGLRLTRTSTASCARTRARRDLIFGPRALVDFLAEAITLEPGDLILTGTPNGVGMALDPPRYLGGGRRRALRGRGARRGRACDRVPLLTSSASRRASLETPAPSVFCARPSIQ